MSNRPASQLRRPAQLLLAVGIIGCTIIAGSFARAASINLHSADFDILDARTQKVIGTAHFDIGPSRNGHQEVTSEAHYKSGDYDLERDDFNTQTSGALPQMISYLHTFYHPDGGLFLKSNIDFRSGRVACTSYPKGVATLASQTFEMPPDTYAGAATILPLQDSLRDGNKGPIAMDDVVCMPGPKLVKVEARARPPAPWHDYPGAVRTDIKPDFGWLDYLIAPFLPEMHVWFSPANDLELVGAQFSRYYKGPEIILRRADALSGSSAPETRVQALHSR